MISTTFLCLASLVAGEDLSDDFERFLEHLEVHPRALEVQARPLWGELRTGLEARITDITREELMVELMRMLALFEDGHSVVLVPRDIATSMAVLPVGFGRFPDGLFLTACAPDQESLVGARVTAIGGERIEEVEQRFMRLVSADNEHNARQIITHRLRQTLMHRAVGLTKDDTLRLTIDLEGNLEEIELEGDPALSMHFVPEDWARAIDRSSPDLPPGLRQVSRPHWFETLGDGTLWVRHDQVQDGPETTLAAFTAALFETIDREDPPRVVLDLRRNGGGNNYLNQPLVHGLIARPSLSRTPGRLLVAIGPTTYSAAMCLAVELERNTSAIFVGDPTGARVNHWGDSVDRDLPASGIGLRLSELHWQNSDPRDARPALFPDLPAPLTFEALRSGEDPALAAVRALDAETAATLVADEPNWNWIQRSRR